MLKHAQNIACSSWHGDTVQETLSSHRDGNFKAGNPLQRILFSQVLSKPSNNHLGVALQRNRLNSVLVIKNQIQLANPQYLCLYFKESSFQYAVSSFGLEKVGISSLSMINTTCRTQTQNNQKIKHFTVMVPCANNSLSSASDTLWLELYHNALCPPSVAVKHSLKRDAGTKVAPRAVFFALI